MHPLASVVPSSAFVGSEIVDDVLVGSVALVGSGAPRNSGLISVHPTRRPTRTSPRPLGHREFRRTMAPYPWIPAGESVRGHLASAALAGADRRGGVALSCAFHAEMRERRAVRLPDPRRH